MYLLGGSKIYYPQHTWSIKFYLLERIELSELIVVSICVFLDLLHLSDTPLWYNIMYSRIHTPMTLTATKIIGAAIQPAKFLII